MSAKPSTVIDSCLAFFRSVIKSGEPWTDTCERDYVAAREALKALTPSATSTRLVDEIARTVARDFTPGQPAQETAKLQVAIIDAIYEALTAAGAQIPPVWERPCPVDLSPEPADENFLFKIIKESESLIRRLGLKSTDYSLGHESRMLAQRYEAGDFTRARRMVQGGGFDRDYETGRRRTAVELLLAAGWKWESGKWNAPTEPVGFQVRYLKHIGPFEPALRHNNDRRYYLEHPEAYEIRDLYAGPTLPKVEVS